MVKALDLKSNGFYPRRFEPYSQRIELVNQDTTNVDSRGYKIAEQFGQQLRRDSSVGRASDWRSEGPWFNPGSRHYGHHRPFKISWKYDCTTSRTSDTKEAKRTKAWCNIWEIYFTLKISKEVKFEFESQRTHWREVFSRWRCTSKAHALLFKNQSLLIISLLISNQIDFKYI